jgi:hypothetical protein
MLVFTQAGIEQQFDHAQRIRLDRASEASHDLNRLLDKPVVRRARCQYRK